MDIFENKITKKVANAALECGVNAYIVGGAARDLILGTKVFDLDFLIEGNAIEFAQKSGFKIKSIHEDFGTVKIEIDGETVDAASTRSEKYPAAGGLPVVDKIGISIKDDLKRRDFTINSIAMNILTREIIDPFDGQKDIKAGLLRVLHDMSFIDDPTRILRGIDFKYRFGFDFEPKTALLIENATKGYDRAGLSIDRIYLTLEKLFSSKNAARALSDILEKKIYKIWTKNTELTPGMISELDRAAELFGVSDKSGLFIMALESIPYVKAPFADDFEIFNFFKKFNEAQLALYYFKTGDNSALKYLKIREISPALTGKTLIEAGYEEGKIIGQILNAITKEKVLNPEGLATKEEELSFVLKNFPVTRK